MDRNYFLRVSHWLILRYEPVEKCNVELQPDDIYVSKNYVYITYHCLSTKHVVINIIVYLNLVKIITQKVQDIRSGT